MVHVKHLKFLSIDTFDDGSPVSLRVSKANRLKPDSPLSLR